MRIDFVKMHGLGNDFMVFDAPANGKLPDRDTFRNLELAYYAMQQGGNMPCVLNAANEVAVEAFLHDRIGFLEMSDLISQCLEKADFIKAPTYEEYMACDAETRILARTFLKV